MKAVIDASIVLAALAPDEASPFAMHIIEPFLLGGGHAPALWSFEIANPLYWKVRRGLLSPATAEQALRSAYRIPLTFDQLSPAEVARDVVPLCWKHGLTAYDAAYLELALRLAAPLASIDNALIRAAAAEGVKVL
jgi:predicted nucleic acid-binding protein